MKTFEITVITTTDNKRHVFENVEAESKFDAMLDCIEILQDSEEYGELDTAENFLVGGVEK